MNIGHQTELEVALLATKMGIEVSMPINPECRYDQIWDIKGKLIKVQIKTATLSESGEYIQFNCQAKHIYKENEVDALVTIHNGILYLVPFEEMNKSSYKKLYFNLQKKSAMNYHQVNWAEDYKFSI